MATNVLKNAVNAFHTGAVHRNFIATPGLWHVVKSGPSLKPVIGYVQVKPNDYVPKYLDEPPQFLVPGKNNIELLKGHYFSGYSILLHGYKPENHTLTSLDYNMLVMMGLKQQVQDNFGIDDDDTLNLYLSENELENIIAMAQRFEIDHSLPATQQSLLFQQRVDPDATLSECIVTVPHKQLASFKSKFFMKIDEREYTGHGEYTLGLFHGTPKSPKIYEVFRSEFIVYLTTPDDYYK